MGRADLETRCDRFDFYEFCSLSLDMFGLINHLVAFLILEEEDGQTDLENIRNTLEFDGD